MKTALILGANGQDGTFLTGHLLRQGWAVVGVDLQPSARFTQADRLDYRQIDLRRAEPLAELLRDVKPGLIFHLAAVHTHAAASAEATYELLFSQMLRVNVASVHTLLEHLRLENQAGKLLYASSAKVFGSPLPQAIDESTPRIGSCLYSITKNAATELIWHYRRQHGVKGSVVFLFNHESELRPRHFFVPKLVACLAAAKRGEPRQEIFRTLDFYCDWGSAKEYAELMILMLEKASGQDFVLATGRCVHARQLAYQLFERHGLDVAQHVETMVEHSGDDGATAYQVDLGKLRSHLGRVPSVSISEVIEDMLAHFDDDPAFRR